VLLRASGRASRGLRRLHEYTRHGTGSPSMETVSSLVDTLPHRRSARRSRTRSAGELLVFLAVVAAIAAAEGAVSVGGGGWFDASAQVVWTPPPWFSRTVWAVVFVLLAVAGWDVWRCTRTAAHRGARTGYVLCLVLLAVWPPVYLGGYPLIGPPALWIAFALAAVLTASVVGLALAVWRTARAASVLLLLAACWLLYVATINIGDAVLATLG
jgi:benzodiazapine receptor